MFLHALKSRPSDDKSLNLITLYIVLRSKVSNHLWSSKIDANEWPNVFLKFSQKIVTFTNYYNRLYKQQNFRKKWSPVWPDCAIYWTLGNFSKPLATINLPKSPTFLGNFVEKIYYFLSACIISTSFDLQNETKFKNFLSNHKNFQAWSHTRPSLAEKLKDRRIFFLEWVKFKEPQKPFQIFGNGVHLFLVSGFWNLVPRRWCTSKVTRDAF